MPSNSEGCLESKKDENHSPGKWQPLVYISKCIKYMDQGSIWTISGSVLQCLSPQLPEPLHQSRPGPRWLPPLPPPLPAAKFQGSGWQWQLKSAALENKEVRRVSSGNINPINSVSAKLHQDCSSMTQIQRWVSQPARSHMSQMTHSLTTDRKYGLPVHSNLTPLVYREKKISHTHTKHFRRHI